MPFLTAAGHRLEYRLIDARRRATPMLVFLHEGLGSIELWKDFPDRVADATGCGALVYSRYGYGRSDPLQERRGTDYLHREALESLPAVLGALRIEQPVLIGHSDGASIALICAGAGIRPVRGIVVAAPHVFVEDVTIGGLIAARNAYCDTDLARRLARYHPDVDRVFWGWNDTWLDPGFRTWNIEAYLPGIRVPVLAIQGEDDEYGTFAQLDAIARQVSGPVELVKLADCRHVPHRDQPATTIDAIERFVAAL